MTQPQASNPTSAEQATAVIAAYQAETVSVRSQLEAFIRAVWAQLGGYRNAQMPAFTNQAIPVVEAAMGHMQALTSGYLATLNDLHGGNLTPLPFTQVGVSDVRNGADPVTVYERPFHLVWRQLNELPHEPGAVDQAIKAGEDRAVQLAVTDLQLAKTSTAQQIVQQDKRAIGYRRVLEGPHSCGLCIVASTQLYHKAKLLPIHPACDCGVAPVYSGTDPALAANQRHLGDVHAAIADRFGKSSPAARAIPGGKGAGYSDVIVEHHDGEIGPVLGVRGQDWTGPKDLHH